MQATRVRARTIYYVGFDPGSGFATLVVTPVAFDDRGPHQLSSHYLTIPSLIGSAKFAEFTNSRATRLHATLAQVMQPGELAVGYNRQEYFIGTLAEKEGTNTSAAKGALKRYTDLHARLLFLGMYGHLVADPESEVRLVTGVPMSLFTPEIRKKVRDNLEGEHRFTWNGQERTVTVTVGTVTREGLKTLALYGSSNQKVRQGVIDIGERTTDIGQADGQTPINRWCKAEVYGVGRVIDTLISEIRTRYHRSLRLSEARALLRASIDNRPLPPVKVGKLPIPDEEILAMIEAARQAEWTAIDTFLDTCWNEEGVDVGANLELILCVGGGARVWEKELKTKFPQAVFPEASALFPEVEREAGEIANAEAYHALALDLEEIDSTIWQREPR